MHTLPALKENIFLLVLFPDIMICINVNIFYICASNTTTKTNDWQQHRNIRSV